MWWQPGKTKVYENILKFRTLTTQIRTWVERDREGPCDQEDYANMGNWVTANRVRIDGQSLQDTAEEMAREFPRISAIEVQNGSQTNGVLIYPRWP